MGVIGDPVEHTMSPAMHNAAARQLGLDLVYVAFHVASRDLGDACRGIRGLGLLGVNVTIPHKVDIVRHLDRVDPLAASIGAVNTVKNEGGKLAGRNTDAEGVLQALDDAGWSPDGKVAVVFGAGGAARATCFALLATVSRLRVVNRTADRGRRLAEHLKKVAEREGHPAEITSHDLDADLKALLADADLLVNCTSVGMHPRPEASVVPAGALHGGLVVFDAVYNPLETRLLRDAESAGCRTISGLDMLVNQGAIAFEWWTGRAPDRSVMKAAALERLTGGRPR